MTNDTFRAESPERRGRGTIRLIGALLLVSAVVTGIAVVPREDASADRYKRYGWSTNAAAKSIVRRGRTVTVTARVASASARRGRVAVLIRNRNGKLVARRSFGLVRFRAGAPRAFTMNWVVPRNEVLGAHVVRVRVRQPAGRRHLNRHAETFSVKRSITTPRPSTPPPPRGTQFFEGFSAAASLGRFEFKVHVSRNGGVQAPLKPQWQGEHNMACEGPTTHRTVHGGHVTGTRVGELVWWCAPGGPETGHFMTAVDTGDVATLSFSPRQTFTDVRRVCWAQNMNNLGEGKWPNMYVVPADHVADHGGDLSYAAGLGGELDGSLIEIPAGALNVTWFRGSFVAYQGTGTTSYRPIVDVWGSIPENMEPTPAPRRRICAEDLGNGTMRFTVERPDGHTDTFTGSGSMPNGRVRVIWQDGSYNPDKHAGTGHLTWHWDDIAIS